MKYRYETATMDNGRFWIIKRYDNGYDVPESDVTDLPIMEVNKRLSDLNNSIPHRKYHDA